MAAGKGAGRGGVDHLDVGGQITFICKTFATVMVRAGEGRRGGGVDGDDVSGEGTSLCEAFATNCTREDRRVGRVDCLDV